MSGALPSARLPSGVVITSWSPTLVSRAQNMRTQRRRRGAGVQRWMLRYVYNGLTLDQHQDLDGFLAAQRGQYENFTLTLPERYTPRGSWGGAPLAMGAAAAGASSVSVDGLTPSVSGAGKTGDFFKFAGHAKVYRLTANMDTNGAGQGTLPFMPALNVAVADNEAIVFAQVPFTVILSGDQSAVSLEPALIGSLEFTAIEDV